MSDITSEGVRKRGAAIEILFDWEKKKTTLELLHTKTDTIFTSGYVFSKKVEIK